MGFKNCKQLGHRSIVDKSSVQKPEEEENLFVSLCIYMLFKKDRNK